MTGAELLKALAKMDEKDLRKHIHFCVSICFGEDDRGAIFTVNEITATPKALVIT